MSSGIDWLAGIFSKPVASISALRKCVGVNVSGFPKRSCQMPGATDLICGMAESVCAARTAFETISIKQTDRKAVAVVDWNREQRDGIFIEMETV